MKFLLIYGVLFLTISQTFSNPVDEECGTNKDVFQGCSDDCTGQTFCINNHLITLDCKLQSGGEKPYCNLATNLCQSTEVPCNPPKPNEFQCPDQDAFYPDPLDCTKYYQCKNKIKNSGNCYSGYKFNPKKTKCDKLTRCVQFSLEKGECRNKIGKYVVHPLDKNIYVKCETYPILMRCPTDNIFDSKTQECRYNCVKRGTFPDNDNEEYFYVCEKKGLHWQPKHEKCSDGMIYDRNFVGCILKDSSEEKSPEEPSSNEETTEEASSNEVSTEKPSSNEVSTEEPSSNEVTTEKPSSNEVSTEEPSSNEVTTEKPSSNEVSTEEPSSNEVSTEEPSSNEVSTKEPSSNEVSSE